MHEEKIEGIEKWKVESDLRTLKELESVFANPSRLKAVKALAKQEMSALSKIAKGKKMSYDDKPDMEYSHGHDSMGYDKPEKAHKLN